MEYGETHQMLLRTLLARGVLPLPEAKRLLREYSDQELAIADVIKDINEQIRPFQQNVKLATDELTNEQALVFLSLGHDDITKSQTVFSQPELQYFRVLIEQIVTAERRQVSGIAALNLVNTLKATLSKHDAEKLLSTWCAMRYLEKAEGSYCLGLRSVHEFEGYLRRNMPDSLEECSLCKQIVFKGCNCPGCGVAVHTRCLNKYLEKVQRWPCCKVDYTGPPDDETAQRRYPTMSQDDASPGTSHDDEVLNISQDYDLEETEDMTAHSQESVEEGELTQASALGISQTSTVRKRKRQW